MKNNKKNVREAMGLAREMAFSAGKILLRYQKKIASLKVDHKKAQGVVSEADICSERQIIKTIGKYYPDQSILAEESAYNESMGKKGNYCHYQQSEWCWIIDPLDGTNNFLNGLDYFSISIGLAHKGIPVMGLLYAPRRQELFEAVLGEGAKYYNAREESKGVKIFCKTNNKKLSDALLVTGFAAEKGLPLDRELKIFKKMTERARGVRRMGSAALDLCHVASGQFDGFWERELSPWDVAAAGLICQEAGVKVTNYKNGPFSPFDNTIIAARRPFHEKMIGNL